MFGKKLLYALDSLLHFCAAYFDRAFLTVSIIMAKYENTKLLYALDSLLHFCAAFFDRAFLMVSIIMAKYEIRKYEAVVRSRLVTSFLCGFL